MTPLEWKTDQWAQHKAGQQADAIARRLGLKYPIDPLTVAKEEYPRLRAGGRDFGNGFDGKLRYNSEKRCFLLLYNTKYDRGYSPGTHHPRTRFTIAHELGHYFIERHHAYLIHGGKSHASINEFHSLVAIEREADAFAASLLLPTHLIQPLVNADLLSASCIKDIAGKFETSWVSTAIRSVQLSHFPCALAGIRDGKIAWMFASESLIDAGIYPNRGSLPPGAEEQWADFQDGADDEGESEGQVRNWFKTYDNDDLPGIYVAEEYIPVRSMGTLLVLITLNEQDVFPEEDDQDDDDDY